ncbi:MAG: tetratricopeptide repeat protein [Spirochaetaceae bacterium]|jgi:Flp pilus assembly protein TadD|nr:tetratricopeptide repeat protein [Spirochaetaceae bacterium]
MKQAAKGEVVFISVPESLRGQIESPDRRGDGADFCIDPAIPIPVELPPGETSLDLERLSWEMILAGMIRVAGDNPDDEDADYYRRFVLSVKPGIFNEFTEAAILKARNRDYDMALEIIEALEGLFPRSPVVLLNRALFLEGKAEALEKSGREEEAEAENKRAQAAYGKVLSLNPPFPNALFNGGYFFMKRRQFQEARNCFSAYISLAEDPAKREQARILVRKIEALGPDDELFRDAYDCIRAGEIQRGLEKTRSFLERHPNAQNGWFILGWALRRLSRWEDAAASLRKALELGNVDGDTRNELAICLMETGDLKGARKELEAALREEPDNIKIISNLGVLALKNGDDHEAAAFFRAVLELEPGDPVAAAYLRGEPLFRRPGPS